MMLDLGVDLTLRLWVDREHSLGLLAVGRC